MKLEIEGLDEFMGKLKVAANGGFVDKLGEWLEAMGLEFLDLIQDEIIRTKTVDTRLLLNSFKRGDGDNVFSLTDGGMTLDVGTNVNYASYANDGHLQNKSGVARRWVPGYWTGNRFVYEPGAKTGMMLKQKWIEGTQYWDSALAIFDRMFEKSLDRLLQKWIDESF